MKQLFLLMHPQTRKIAVAGLILVVCAIAASCVLYIGAGKTFDYHTSKDAAEKLLALSRTLGVALSCALLFAEHRMRAKER